ncbi:type II toxin-antitoxin system RelE/ParE family toxin [Pantanalinema rosaneae CENA516]|uniref:type II toxin-antitoxin system RelE/ParE family toxin n=1 Tax=Pantanalinema rosaneae TaxID=1620701 RepID=UPI003D6E5524
MAKSVKWLRKALKSLEQAYDYMAQHDLDAAISLVLKIQAATEQLAEFPLMGRMGRVNGTRELVITNTPYIVIYRVNGRAVEILRVLHSAKRYPE